MLVDISFNALMTTVAVADSYYEATAFCR